MGEPPKVQPTFTGINHTGNKVLLVYTALVGCNLKYSLRLLILNKTLDYTALIGVPPKVQPTFAEINHTGNKVLPVYTALVGVPHRKHWRFRKCMYN